MYSLHIDDLPHWFYVDVKIAQERQLSPMRLHIGGIGTVNTLLPCTSETIYHKTIWIGMNVTIWSASNVQLWQVV